jgi:hypothetical protein
MQRRPTWIRVATWLSALWSVLIVGLVANALLSAPSFESAAAVPCGQFLVPLAGPVERALQRIDSRFYLPIVRWRDAKSREDINPYRRGEQVLSCATLEQRARVFLEASRKDIIAPQVSVHRRRLALLIVLPCLLFVVVSYLAFNRRTQPASLR